MNEFAKEKVIQIKILIYMFICLGFITSICEAKSYKVVVGYENEQLEIPLTLGRSSANKSIVSMPTSQQMKSKFPISKDIKTVVPANNPIQTPTNLIPVEDAIPMMHGGLPQDGNAVTAANIKLKLDADGRAIIDNITFAFNQSNLTSKSIPSLNAIKNYLKENPSVNITIEGHCDTSGDASINPILSMDRASAVKSWLVNNGIDTYRLNAVGMSDNYPIADNSTAEGQAKNRRVEIVKDN